jgi:hypothetical protein
MTEIKTIVSADYNLNVLPTNNKTWREADKLEVAFTLKTDTETKTFKGIIDLFGIVSKGD